MFYKPKNCPICKSTNYVNLKSNYKNVYSDLLSKELSINEEELLNSKYKSARCNTCSTIFWLDPINEEIREKLYTKILPTHPKGEDSTGKYFCIEGMYKKLNGLSNSSEKRKRIIEGYISSMVFNDSLEEKIIINGFNENIQSELFLKTIEKVFKRGAKPYSRHVGFRNTDLNSRIIELTNNLRPDQYNYSEYGCIDWGPINIFNKSNLKCLSIIPKNTIFWDCSKDNILKDKDHLVLHEGDPILNKKSFKNSVLGLFLVLDHIDSPLDFIFYFLNRGVSAIVILLEKDEGKGIPIQHLSLWSEKSLLYLAKRFSMNIKFPSLQSEKYISAILTKNKG